MSAESLMRAARPHRSASHPSCRPRPVFSFRRAHPTPSSLTAPSGARLSGSAAVVAGEPDEAGGAGEAQEEVAALKELCRDLLTQKQVPPRNLNPKSNLFKGKDISQICGFAFV